MQITLLNSNITKRSAFINSAHSLRAALRAKRLCLKVLTSLISSLAILVMLTATIFYSSPVKAQLDATEYTLGSGDMVRITVFGQNDLTVETKLSNVGVIRYPFLGDITLIGKTVNQVEQIIDKGLRGDYLINPSVSVTVLEYRPFFIDGEVKQPGGYPYQPGLSVGKAAALAGGYTERAASKGEMIVRRNIQGKEVTLELTANDIILPGDSITVQARFF
jgi:polysaccharide export outer membrane protein